MDGCTLLILNREILETALLSICMHHFYILFTLYYHVKKQYFLMFLLQVYLFITFLLTPLIFTFPFAAITQQSSPLWD